ncbi:phosphoribosylanthranilate isomerase [Actinomarinicola tropica]|uniref:N-(5'-phosphoribosyl)anthranilate isomerase n=1 Tax=Actinomarinicola tropica TaxID=2789776 RepID=A0A5Q2RNM7_9ACTN|nr:phosphoribosylanthranilate isomerase [Actinomarinicola tropica]QGG95500.1 phosphoribosylanthranilate isomerase [Actinomarinicola tropica]
MFVKICGITSEDDALLAVAMGADALGFVFAPSSRQVAAGHVRDIVRRLPPEILTLGVFRDEAPQRVVEQVQTAGLGGAQLHGHETPEDARFVRARVGFLVQAFPAGADALRRSDEWGADVILIDSPTPGSGQVFDWSLAEGAPSGRRILLAGGLTPDNVGDAIARVRPWGVDVSSGVESSPGRKDPRKVRAFVAAAKAAGEDLEHDHAPTGALYDWQEEGG